MTRRINMASSSEWIFFVKPLGFHMSTCAMVTGFHTLVAAQRKLLPRQSLGQRVKANIIRLYQRQIERAVGCSQVCRKQVLIASAILDESAKADDRSAKSTEERYEIRNEQARRTVDVSHWPSRDRHRDFLCG